MYNTPTRGPGTQLVLTGHRGLILLFMGKAEGGDEFRSEQVWGTCRMEAGEKSTTGHWGWVWSSEGEQMLELIWLDGA